MTLSSCLLAICLAPSPPNSKVLAIDVMLGDRQIARSLIMTCFIPGSQEKTRFFFSRTTAEGSYTEVRTWLKSDGTPVRSIETAVSKVLKTTADAEFANGSISVTFRQERTGNRLVGFPIVKKISVPAGSSIRGGLFDPAFLVAKPSPEPINFYVLNPWRNALEKYELLGGEVVEGSDGEHVRYRVKGPVKESEMTVDGEGFLRSKESDGTRLERSAPRQYELIEMKQLAATIRMR